MKQVDFKVSLKFHDDGHTSIDFGALVPAEFEKQSKQLTAWNHGMVVSLREAVIKWSKSHAKVTRREVRRLERINNRFAKAVEKVKQKELAKAGAQ
ncbi:MAG: hypothetical protein VB025_07485 [Sphaerochaeta sp.]|nr:hypothetical protein [Sphaerochaeta sp.]